MAQQVKVNVTIGGQAISPIADLDISQSLFDHNVIQVIIPLDAFKNNNSHILNQAKDYLNQELTVEITSGIFSHLNRDFTFEGVVTDIRMSRSRDSRRMIFVTAYSPTIYLSGVSNTRSFHEMTLADIVNQVLQDVPANVKTQVDPAYAKTLEYVVQYRETNMQFLQRLADTYGEWLYYDGDELIFGRTPNAEVIDLPLNEDLLDMNLAMRVVPVNFKAKAYDYMKHEVHESSASPSQITDLDDFGKDILSNLEPNAYLGESLNMPYQEFREANDLDDHVRHEMATRARDMVTLSGTTDHIKLRVGTTINITGEKANEVDLEKFIIVAINHSIDESFSYTNTIEAIPAAAASPPDNPRVRVPFAEPQQATVTQNDDPDKLGRVKVQFKWQKNEETPWIRLIQPYAGQASGLYGFYFTPELEDEVIVGFINDNPDLPYVMGSVYRYHKSNSPEEWHDADNHRKVIRTRSGNQIHFIDEDGKEEIIITNKDKDVDKATNQIRLSMDGDGKITIKTLGELDIQAKSISMKADEKIDIDAGTEASLKTGQALKIESGTETKIKSGTETKIEASTSVTVKGNSDVSIEGAMTSVKGQGQLDLDGGAMASLKGGLVKIN